MPGLWCAAGIGLAAAATGQTLPPVLDIEAVTGRGALVLRAGEELCLAGIWPPASGSGQEGRAGWPSAWRAALDEGGFRYRIAAPERRDRYGCRLAAVETADGVPLQHALLAAGWATVDPLTAEGDGAAIDAMLVLEDQARSAGRGIWRERAALPRRPDDLRGLIGTRQLVEGRVERVYANDRHVYLNFGADWRTDFTARLDRAMIEAVGFDAAHFDGKLLRLRGVLEEARGPLMTISHLKQLEFLP